MKLLITLANKGLLFAVSFVLGLLCLCSARPAEAWSGCGWTNCNPDQHPFYCCLQVTPTTCNKYAFGWCLYLSTWDSTIVQHYDPGYCVDNSDGFTGVCVSDRPGGGGN
jgi:hypothetical protein